jgi:hypothetical protein
MTAMGSTIGIPLFPRLEESTSVERHPVERFVINVGLVQYNRTNLNVSVMCVQFQLPVFFPNGRPDGDSGSIRFNVVAPRLTIIADHIIEGIVSDATVPINAVHWRSGTACKAKNQSQQGYENSEGVNRFIRLLFHAASGYAADHLQQAHQTIGNGTCDWDGQYPGPDHAFHHRPFNGIETLGCSYTHDRSRNIVSS